MSAISIKNYADLTSKVILDPAGAKHLSGLVFTDSEMDGSPNDAYARIVAKYNAGEVVKLSYDDVTVLFTEDSEVRDFLLKYFGVNAGNYTPRFVNVRKVLSPSETRETAKKAYQDTVANFTDFGAFTFVGHYSTSDLADIAALNESSSSVFVICEVLGSTVPSWITNIGSAKRTVVMNGASAFAEYSSGIAYKKGDHIKNDSNFYVANANITATENTGISAITSKLDSSNEMSLDAWSILGWYASCNYAKSNASDTIDYRTFAGLKPTVDTDAVKAVMDAANINYIGKVQVYGSQMSFMQKGVTLSGQDLGTLRDEHWIRSEIEIGWINAASGGSKIPANAQGASRCYAIVSDVANRAIENGSILINKTLDNAKKIEIVGYADEAAVDEVIDTGYAIRDGIVKDGNTYAYQYVMVYAKGDHIGKIIGSHILY